MSKKETLSRLEQLKAMLGKSYAEKVEAKPPEVISTGLNSLDYKVFGIGGIPRGRHIDIMSKSSAGKSTFLLFLIGIVQRNVPDGGICSLIETEGTYTDEYARACGVNTEMLIKHLDDFTTGEHALYIYKQELATNLFDLIAVDSFTKLVPESISEAKAEKSSQYDKLQLASMSTDFFTTLGGYSIRDNDGNYIKSDKKFVVGNKVIDNWHRLRDKRTISVAVHHAKDDLSAMRPGVIKAKGGTGSEFESTIRLVLKNRGVKMRGDKLEYKKIEVLCTKNKLAPPFGSTALLMYGDGRIEETEGEGILVDFAVANKLITKKGTWYFYEGKQIGQGKDAVLKWLEDNPEIKETILK